MNAQEQITEWKKIEKQRLEKAHKAWEKLHKGQKLTKAEL